MSTSDTSINVPISCLCGKHKHVYAIPRSITTMEYFICHCNSCRRSSGGSLYQGAIVWTYPLKAVSETDVTPEDPKTLLKHYPFGPILDYWFCETCSTKMYWQYKKPDAELELFPGLVPQSLVEDGNIELSCLMQVLVGDTLDEGLSRSFRAATGEVGERRQGLPKGPLYEAPHILKAHSSSTTPIRGKCHCGRVDLVLSRSDGRRLPVEVDISEDSRLLNSVDMSVWALVNPKDVIAINNMPLNILEKLLWSGNGSQAGPLSVYQSGQDRQKAFFCNGCSATVFVKPSSLSQTSLLKIGAGLLESQSGARAEDILDWSSVEPLEIKRRHIQLDPQDFTSK